MKRFLTEGSHYDKDAIKILVNSGLFNEQQATTIINAWKDVDIHAFTHCPNWLLKYLKGMARMLVDDMKKGADFTTWVNNCIDVFEPYLTWVKKVREKLPTNEQLQLDDEFVNKMSFKDVEKKWEKIQDEMDEESKAELAKMGFGKKSNYKLYPINSYDELHSQFGGRATGDGSSDAYAGGGGTAWCHTNSRGVYDSWVDGGKNKFFILAKDGWQDIPFNKETNREMVGKDEYGNSLIALLVSKYGRLKRATLRCNHCGVPSNADNQYNTYAELSKLAGFNVEEEVKKYCEEKITKFNKDNIWKIWENGTDGKTFGRVVIDRYDDDYDEEDKALYKELFQEITEVVVPDGVNTISSYTFSSCPNLKKVSLPNTLKHIDENAFYYCSNLKSIEIPDSVTSIREEAFRYSGLVNVKLPRNNVTIGRYIFCETPLEEVVIPEGWVMVSGYAFQGCKNLKRVFLAPTVEKIYDTAFANCISLEEINLDSIMLISNNAFSGDGGLKNIGSIKNLKNIGQYAFEDCGNLPDLVMPSGVTVENNAFSDCRFTLDFEDMQEGGEPTRLKPGAFAGFGGTLVKLPKGLVEIPYSLFSDSEMESITIPSTVTSIGEEAFANSKIKKIVIPESVTDIDNGAFKRCTGLTEVVIPSQLSTIPYGCFAGCTNLAIIHTANNTEEGASVGGVDLSKCTNLTTIEEYAFEKCGKLGGEKGTIILPESLEEIKQYAFSLCKSIQQVKLPESLTKIGSKAFCDCKNLKDIVIPGGVRIVEAFAFNGCINLSRAVISEGVEGLNTSTFEGCQKLVDVKLPKSLKGISGEVFLGCNSLRKLVLPEGLEILKVYVFSECENLETLYIPTSLKSITSNSLDFDSDVTIYTKNETVIEMCKRLHINYSTETSQFVGESLIRESLDEKLNNPKIEEINDFIEDVYDLRQQGLNTEGEYSLGNLIFKEFRNLGYLDNLKQMKNELTGKDLSLEGMDESLLTEGTKYDKQAEKILVDSGLVNEEVAHTIIDALYKTDIHAFVHSPNWLEKYLKGIARMIVEECKGNVMNLQGFLEQAPSVFDEYLEYVKENRDKIGASMDNEFINKMSYEDVVNKVEEVRQERDKKSKEELKKMKLSKDSDFSIVPIESFEDFNKKYGGKLTGDGSSDKFAGGGGTAWCHANSNPTYDIWVNKGKNRFFVLQNNKWKDIKFDRESNEKEKGKDIYGNSLIAILTDKYGRLLKNTLRCNHCGIEGNADRAYKDYAELSRVAGFNVEEEIAKYCEPYDPSKPDYKFITLGATLVGLGDLEGNPLEDVEPETYVQIEELNIPEDLGVTVIGSTAFSYMKRLKKVTIPKGITTIEENAFRGCSLLQEVILPEGLEVIGDSAFYDCGGYEELLHIELPSTINEIDDYAFSNAGLGPLLVLPQSLRYIGERAFGSCYLGKVIFNCERLVIGEQAFIYNEHLKDVIFNVDTVYTESSQGSSFAKCKELTDESKEAIEKHIYGVDMGDVDELDDDDFEDLEDLPDFDFDDEDINLDDVTDEDDEPYQWRNTDDWNWGDDDWND